jgi:hypothetical protein
MQPWFHRSTGLMLARSPAAGRRQARPGELGRLCPMCGQSTAARLEQRRTANSHVLAVSPERRTES